MKDYRDMLSSLKDKVVDVAGKATVAVTDVAGQGRQRRDARQGRRRRTHRE